MAQLCSGRWHKPKSSPVLGRHSGWTELPGSGQWASGNTSQHPLEVRLVSDSDEEAQAEQTDKPLEPIHPRIADHLEAIKSGKRMLCCLHRSSGVPGWYPEF